MQLQLELPHSFVIAGIPVSSQASGTLRERWKQAVAAAARETLPEGYWASTGSVAVTIIYFSQGSSGLDVDNLAKPILDALAGVVWIDDAQVEELRVRKTDLSTLLAFKNPPPELGAALSAKEPFVFVQVSDKIAHEELPG